MKLHWPKHSLLSLALVLLLVSGISCIIIPLEPPPEATPAPPPTPPTINLFTAEPATITAGQSVILTWNVAGARTITIQPTINDVGPMGTLLVSPSQSTVYTLIASNEGGSVTSYVGITLQTIDTTPSQKFIGVDPVSGRNQGIGFEWEQLCLSNRYQVQIAKDSRFTLMVFDTGVYTPGSVTSPAMLYQAGGRLEAGHTYYWRARVREAVTGQVILGPWSAPQQFTIGAGYPVTIPYEGIQLLSPVTSCLGYPSKSVPFTWSPFKQTSRYQFILAKDPSLTAIVSTAEVPTTSYVYQGTLDYSTSYFWQVTATQPAPSDPSLVFTFTTEAKPLPAPQPEPQATELPTTPLWVWVIIGAGSALLIAMIVLVLMIRR